ncbi:Sec-independent protein translocase subunit TatA [Amycolatopsis taiwanensis]|uniref:Sec-independent protein translocase protein TatA n=1 Tax=Amycolatopsis taiwanensis TaxID=342230 RepID=A0A9W6R3A5_9PSEU|nr:Sec-independent protein translocase subunit TatA [Amycolatopsis taiwanensis]GLY67738.1 sec-independent protein translocase protein TatA [Amycolatopsis taiwanensis]
MLNGLQPWHLIIVLVVLVLLFGAKRLPDAARSVGKSMKIFKAETKSMQDSADESEPAETKQLPSATAQPKASDQQVADLQRQLDELKKQQNTGTDQPQKHAS